MPGNPGASVNRYLDIITGIPRGQFYLTNGVRIPYQGSKPFDLVLQTSVPVRTFGLFINDKFQGEITTDSGGFARFSAILDVGRNDVVLEDDITGQRITTYLDSLVMHTWHAALAEIIEDIDENIQDTTDDRRLEAATAGQIDDVWGKRLASPNSPAYQLTAYREVLQEVHQGYRMFGGKDHGLDNVIAAYTDVTPLNFPFRTFGPRWALGDSFLRNAQFQDRNRTQFSRTSAIPGVTITSIAASNQTGSGTLTFTFAGTLLKWTTPGGAAGPNVAIGAGGTFVIPGVALAARFDGRVNGPYAIVAATNDKLRLNIDGKGSIDITLTAGGAVTAATVAADINGALTADTRYGAGYAATATVIATSRIRLTSVVTGTLGSIVLENISADAYFTVFGYPWVRSTLTGVEAIGSTVLNLVSSDDFQDASSTTYTYKVLIARNVSAREETIEIISNDRVADTLTTIASGLVIAKVGGDTVEEQGAFPYATFGSRNEQQGVTVSIVTASLPGIDDTETVTVGGSNVPDFWLADNVTTADLLPYGFFDFEQLTLSNDGTGDTTLQAEADDRVFQYREWPFVFSVWVRNRHTAAINVFLGVNYGSGWVESGATSVPSIDTGSGDKMTFISFNTTLPSTATQFLVRIRYAATGAGQTVELAHAALRQPNVTALNLGINTTPRSDHRGFLGELIYIWSPVALTTNEKNLVGLSSPTTLGHVDFVLPAHVEGDRFDISSYSGATPINVRGAFDEADLISGTLTNMGLVVRTPGRRSFLKPTRISQVTGEVLSFPQPPVAPFVATLAVSSDQVENSAVLYENGLPVPNNTWQFNSATQIQVTSGFNVQAQYTFDYQALIRFESPVIDLLATFGDYVWYVDYMAWTRFEPTLVEVQRTIQVIFNTQNLRAILADRSNQDITQTTLVENNGLVVRTVPISGYRYVDARTLQIAPDQFKPDALYFLTFQALRVRNEQVPNIIVERRRAADLGALAAASYVVTSKDAVLPATGRYLQYKVSIGDVVDVRDVRLSSVGAKGLGLIGTGLTVPILRS